MKFLTVDFPLYELWNFEVQFADNTLEAMFTDADGTGHSVAFKGAVVWKWTHYPLCGDVEGALTLDLKSSWPKEFTARLTETMSAREAEAMLEANPLHHYRLTLEELGSLEVLAGSVRAR